MTDGQVDCATPSAGRRRPLLRLSHMTAGLAVGVTVCVAAATGAGAYLYAQRQSRTLLENARETARTQGELIRAALEYQMLQDDRTLIAQMIETFGRQPNAERVALLDREGLVAFSSTSTDESDFAPDSSTCQACHQFPAAQRMDSRVIETRGGSVLRTVIPVMNKPECHECHDPGDRINGVLMLDVNMKTIRAGMDRDLRWMTSATIALTLVLVGGIAMVVRVVILQRLRRFETAARLIAGGDLAQRVPAEGTDTIAWLAHEFNAMADSMTGLVHQVHGQQRRLETVINSIDDGIVVLDPSRRVIAANDAFLRRTGHTRDLVLGSCCLDVGPGTCVPANCPAVACMRSRERQVRICERRTSDGELRWEEVHASPITGPTGELLQVVEVWRDISDRRAAEARLAESHRLASVGMLASGFSHELNTPLGTVLTCVEGILKETDVETDASHVWPRVSQRASIARDQILRCRGITQHFLRMSRGQPSAADIVDVQATLTAAARLVEPTARAAGVGIGVPAGVTGLHVRTDEMALQHVLINLLLNAVQASPRDAQVTVELEGDDRIHVRVIDRGCGIAPEHKARIFEPFFSLRQGGTGLGLFLSLNFVRQAGGDIAVTSEPGQGSAFEVTLPCAHIVPSSLLAPPSLGTSA